LADLVGTKQSSIARLERGTTPPNLSFLSKVAAALGARVEVHLTPVQD
jgi:predicted transcriptional regulator